MAAIYARKSTEQNRVSDDDPTELSAKGGTMKKLLVLIIPLVLLASGCVQTVYSKSVSIKKDAKGEILERIETETVSQPGTGWPVQFDHLKGVQP